MATVNAAGQLQLEQEDILPREVARRTDDHPEVIALIESVNPTIETAEDLAAAIEQVDALRREYATKANIDNPFIAKSVDEVQEDKPQAKKSAKRLDIECP